MDLKDETQQTREFTAKELVLAHGSFVQKERVFVSVQQRSAFRLLHLPFFDYAMGVVILLNMLIIIVETDQSAISDEDLSWATAVGWTILLIFVVELALRLYVFRREFFHDAWNVFDFAIVVTDAAFSFLGLILGSAFPVSTLRVFRLCKLARISKVFRMFPELRLMMAGLVGALRAIFWGMVLLGFFLLVWSILAVQFIHPLNKDLVENGAYQGCERCPRAYQSVMETSLTFWQQIVAGDSWGQATIPLIEHYPATGVYFIMVFLSVGMAVLNLILGVVVNVASRAHDDLKVEIDDEKRMERLEVHSHLLEICASMDTDGSGELTREELEVGYKEREDFRNTFIEMDLQEEDLEIVWTIMDTDRSGKVSYSEFVNQIYKLKNSDSQFMLAYIKYYITIMKNNMADQMAAQQAQLMEANEKVEEEIEHLEDEEKKVFDKVQAEADLLHDLIGNGTSSPSIVRSLEENDPPSLLRQLSSGKEPPSLKDGPCPLQDCMSSKPPQEGNAVASDANTDVKRELSGESPSARARRSQSTESGGNHVCREVLVNSELFQVELREIIRDMKQSLDLNVLNTSRLLTELLPQRPPQDDLLAEPHSKTNGFLAMPACCKHRTAINTIIVPNSDSTAELLYGRATPMTENTFGR